MKVISLLTVAWFVISCNADNVTPAQAGANQPDLSGASLIKQGTFAGIGGHTATGTVKIFDLSGKKYIVFDPYASESGPDLKVYLSKDAQATEYIRVGQLQATEGKQTYEVKGGGDLSAYPFVHIWCEKFSVEFARAPLN
jgi:hypothetical protein